MIHCLSWTKLANFNTTSGSSRWHRHTATTGCHPKYQATFCALDESRHADHPNEAFSETLNLSWFLSGYPFLTFSRRPGFRIPFLMPGCLEVTSFFQAFLTTIFFWYLKCCRYRWIFIIVVGSTLKWRFHFSIVQFCVWRGWPGLWRDLLEWMCRCTAFRLEYLIHQQFPVSFPTILGHTWKASTLTLVGLISALSMTQYQEAHFSWSCWRELLSTA